MAEGIASNLAAKVLELLAKEAVGEAASWRGARDDLNKLRDTIEMIQARVRDAERQQEGANSDAIKLWLQRLRLVLYLADDLFDEVLTLDLLKQQQMEKSMLCKVGILFTKFGPLCYNRKLANEIKSIRIQLDAINSDMAALNLNVLPVQEPSMAPLLENRETTSVLKETVTGREIDKNKIIEMLFDPKYDGEDITVIPIVGFGGLGKTTLAQLVFNDERVQNHFKLRRWAYVPEKNNLNVIKGKIFHAFTHNNYQTQTLEDIVQGIKKSIATQKYLLVLDDLWTDKGADITELLSLLKGGKHGSKVVVTTRLDAVAKHFGPIQAAYKLGTLSDDKSWELFKKLAFGPGQENNKSELSIIGQDIVKLCGNVPLAIEVVGGSLRSKHTQAEWLQVKHDLSEAQLADYHDIMAILKVSYDSLSPILKPCFAYCSLIPKGYEFEKDELVHLWMAQGYVELDKGQQYFWDLVARNLFQVTKGFNDVYKMHDLLHDLAQAVAGDESVMLGNERPDEIYNRLVHVNLNGSESPPSLKNANRLRSLLNFDSNATDDKLFLEFQSLRALSMRHVKNEKLLNPIRRLIHLRYLELESDEIEYLPDSITRLVNLQTLNLESCNSLKVLPRDFARLVNLRHLLLPNGLTELPPGFGKLISLQQLNRFIVGKGNGMDSLGAWNHRGELDIKFLRWRRDVIEEVKRTNLKNNHQLTSLTLQLGFWEEESTPAAASEMNEILRCLQLPPNLKYLKVSWYKGDEMPVRWFDGLSQLVSIEISWCRECKVVPKLSGLPNLKNLELYELEELEYVEDEDEDNISVGNASATHNNRCFFPSLEDLKLKYCYKLKGWRRSASKDEGERFQLVFPCLLKMQVQECPMLMSMPLAPKLESLDVCEINWKMVETSKVRSNDDKEEAAASSSSAPPSSSSSTLSTSLKELEIKCVNDGLITLSISSSTLCNLGVLRIEECSELRKLRFESPNSIRKLEIRKCSRLKDISEGLQHLCGLEELDIYDCEELVLEEEEEQQQREEEEEGKSSSGGWQGLSSLRELTLRKIPKMKSLPRGIGCLTTLQELRVIAVKNLTEIPEEIGSLSLLRVLWIGGCPKVKSLPPSILGLPKLQDLYLLNMENLTELPAGEIGNGTLPLLRCLDIRHCPKMTSLPPSILGLPMLQELVIWKMENLTELAAGEIGNGTLPLLRDLDIQQCPKVKSLPTLIQGLTSLQTLIIEGCPDLAKKNMPGGEDWHLIQHIPTLHISDGSRRYRRINGKEVRV